MQSPSGPFEQSPSNASLLQSGSISCSNSTLSDTGSWDTDFDDDQNSESSGFYGDVGPSLVEKSSLGKGTKTTIGQGRVAALAKTVAASLAASGHSSPAKFQRVNSKNETSPSKVNNVDATGNCLTSRSADGIAQKPLAKSSSVSHQGIPPGRNFSRSTHQSLLVNNNFPSSEKKVFSGISNFPNVKKTNFNTTINNNGSLPKPPESGSEQVQQVIGALGHLWSSDSMSLSSQTQSDDDYEPVQSDSSPQMARLSPHPLTNGGLNMCRLDDSSNRQIYQNDSMCNNAAVPSFLHSSLRGPHEQNSSTNASPTLPQSSTQTSSQSTPFLHSSAAAAALAAVAASAAACRLSHCSKRSSGCDSVYSPSSGSSGSELSNLTVLQGQHCTDGVYEPIEEKQKIIDSPQKSFLHSSQSSEKCESKRSTATVKNLQQDQRPPVPNRPLPPTPRPLVEKSSCETGKGGPLAACLDHQPWFHNVDRKQAEELVKNGIDGYFLIRPSSQSQNPLTLTLWYNERVYNISVRQRKDGRIALGFEKADEQSFSSVEEMVTNYHSENLLLFSRNERTGRTVLTKSPPKQRH